MKTLLCTTVLSGLTISMAPIAFAQVEPAPEPDQARGFDEIVVTAQKRTTSLQKTPIAISAIQGSILEDRGIDDLSNLQSLVPNLFIGQEQDGFKISLRGIGLQGTSSISDSGVAFYIDDNYIPRPSGGSAVFHDIERIEVLRGPQGTLYGRNATGGVVNVISNKPNYDAFGGSVGMTYGSRNLIETRGVVNIPFEGNAALRMSAVYTEEGGYVENTNTGPNSEDLFGTEGDITIRGQFMFGTPDTIEMLVSATHYDVNGTGVAQQFLERNNGGPPPTRALLGTMPADNFDPLVTDNDGLNSVETTTNIMFARLRKDFGGVEGFFQVGKSWSESSLNQDFDGSPVDVSQFFKFQDAESESIELRLSSDTDSPLSWIIGGYYFNEDTYIFRRVELNGLTPGGIINLPDFLLDENGQSKAWAVFGSTTYALSDRLRATVGLRYTEDEKTGTKVTRGNFGAPFPDDIPNAQFPGEAKFDKVTYRAGLEFDATEDIFLYATVSNGYKAGGFNATSSGLPYDPESLDAYEAGMKADLLGNRARLNVDTFYYDYQDLQLTTLRTVNNAPGQFTTNAAAATIYGVELDGQIFITDDLIANASYSFIDAEFDELLNTDPRNPQLGQQDLSGNTLPYVAKNTITAGLTYNQDIGSNGEFMASINTTWHDEIWLREYNDDPVDLVASNTKTDASISYKFVDQGFKITGYVTNIEDDVEKTNIFISPGFIGLSATTAYSKPRTIGIRLDKSF